jgi:RNA polymerase sigma-70 factor, ECF subfamily
MVTSEATLVSRAREGDQDAFAVLYHRYGRLVYSLARHLLGDEERARDVTQETFVRAWQALPRLREDQAFGGWLRIITTNLVRDHGRRRRPEVTMTDDQPDEDSPERDFPDPSPGALEVLTQSETRGFIREAVGKLPEPQRLVVVMHHFEEKPVAEIASELGLPLGTVLSRLARGREALKRRLSPYVEVRG